MPGPDGLTPGDRPALAELVPVLRRAVTLDPRSLVRLRFDGEVATVLVRLPFDVLVSRSVAGAKRARPLDATVRAADALEWFDAGSTDLTANATSAEPANAGYPAPQLRDAEWRTGLPPARGWRRIETVPDAVVRNLVRAGATALQDAAAREGVPGAQPRAEVTDALLDSAVLTVTEDGGGGAATVSLRALSALVRMGFLPPGGEVGVDVAGRWVRVVAEFGSVYLERPGHGLQLR